MDKAPFVYEHKVRWVDTDASGIIHFTAAFRFTEAAEVEWFRAVGLPFRHLMEDLSLTVPRVHVAADFRAPLRFDDELRIRVRPGRVGRSSLALRHEIRRAQDGEGAAPAVEVEIVLVCTDIRIGAAVPWPDEVRRLLVAAGAERREAP